VPVITITGDDRGAFSCISLGRVGPDTVTVVSASGVGFNECLMERGMDVPEILETVLGPQRRDGQLTPCSVSTRYTLKHPPCKVLVQVLPGLVGRVLATVRPCIGSW
jgi:hypothetical protein